jgi:hypothetical protein
MSDLTAIAAFSAAGMSLINVGISGRISSRGTVEQWRMNEERPIVGRVLSEADECARHAMRIPERTEDDGPATYLDIEHHARAQESYQKLLWELAPLQLVAGEKVRKRADELAEMLSTLVRHACNPREHHSKDDFLLMSYFLYQADRASLIEQVRADLGLQPGRRWYMRLGLLSRLLLRTRLVKPRVLGPAHYQMPPPSVP